MVRKVEEETVSAKPTGGKVRSQKDTPGIMKKKQAPSEVKVEKKPSAQKKGKMADEMEDIDDDDRVLASDHDEPTPSKKKSAPKLDVSRPSKQKAPASKVSKPKNKDDSKKTAKKAAKKAAKRAAKKKLQAEKDKIEDLDFDFKQTTENEFAPCKSSPFFDDFFCKEVASNTKATAFKSAIDKNLQVLDKPQFLLPAEAVMRTHLKNRIETYNKKFSAIEFARRAEKGLDTKKADLKFRARYDFITGFRYLLAHIGYQIAQDSAIILASSGKKTLYRHQLASALHVDKSMDNLVNIQLVKDKYQQSVNAQ